MSPKQKLLIKPLVVAIMGTTSAGKTAAAVALARAFKGEIISADSRQVYRGLDIGTGKDLAEYGRGRQRVRNHLLDVADPKRRFNLARYQGLAKKAILEVVGRGHLPLVVGGSGLYLQALVENYELPPRTATAAELAAWQQLGAEALYEELTQRRPDFARRLNESDRHNARRLRRYLEIAAVGLETGTKRESPFNWRLLGIRQPEAMLKSRIKARLQERLEKQGLVAEVERLHKNGLSWARLDSLGLEYRFISRYLRGQISAEEAVSQLETALWRFAKRQQTWFRRWEKQGAEIVWVETILEAKDQLESWLRNS